MITEISAVIVDKLTRFLTDIGIPIVFRELEGDCFLPGIQIINGEMHIDRLTLLYPGDILHEAGHLAIVQSAERPTLNDVSIGKRSMREAEEMMAIAWSYAAAKHLGIDPYLIFHDNGYKGGGTYIAESFEAGNYFGVPMLQWTGLAFEQPDPEDPARPVYPFMLKWVLD